MKLLAALLWVVALGPQEYESADRIYGRVTTAGGDVFQGYIRWGANEGSWADFLHANKELPWENLREAEELDEEYGRRRAQERSVHFMGLRISWDEDDTEVTVASAGLRFGHLRMLDVRDDRRAMLVLKSGQEIEVEGSDVGRGLEIRVDDAQRGAVQLRWRDLETIEFMQAPAGAAPRDRRLFGTVTTQGGLEFVGYVAWDTDEILESDVLDGEDEEGRERDIEFGRIHSIERASRRAATVVLRTGEEIWLRGTNDVDDGNRGIQVADAGLGQVVVPWDEFDTFTLHEPEAATHASYEDFDGGRPLHGTVSRRDGRTLVGELRWDNDEADTWELLDGRQDDIDYDVEFAQVARIERLGYWGSEVTLRDGRVLELEGSNDVDENNKGIFVTLEGGRTVLVRWEDLEAVEFSR